MINSDSRKIFLSHKGSDKATVTDFKETLEVLGYEPWLDEDAMPAGTSRAWASSGNEGLLRSSVLHHAIV